MRYTHFAVLRCCSNLSGLFLWCNLYYIKLAIESPVSFCCNSLEAFIRLVLSKANHLQLDSCLSKCSKVFYAIILRRRLERIPWHCDVILLWKQVILQMIFCVFVWLTSGDQGEHSLICKCALRTAFHLFVVLFLPLKQEVGLDRVPPLTNMVTSPLQTMTNLLLSGCI